MLWVVCNHPAAAVQLLAKKLHKYRMQPKRYMQAAVTAKDRNNSIGALLASLSTVVVTTASIGGGVAVLALGASSVSLVAAAAVTAVVAGQVAAAVAAATATTFLADLFVPARPIYCTHFDKVLAAGTGLIEACVAAQTANTYSVIKTLRLVSKAASKIALNGITGYHVQLIGKRSTRGSVNLEAVKKFLCHSKLTHLSVIAPQPKGCPAGFSNFSGEIQGTAFCLCEIVFPQ